MRTAIFFPVCLLQQLATHLAALLQTRVIAMGPEAAAYNKQPNIYNKQE
jgi:hypothetical protein